MGKRGERAGKLRAGRGDRRENCGQGEGEGGETARVLKKEGVEVAVCGAEGVVHVDALNVVEHPVDQRDGPCDRTRARGIEGRRRRMSARRWWSGHPRSGGRVPITKLRLFSPPVSCTLAT